ncbi:6536_t:CDS:2 [Diversispora eburnea]|uniref:6536_t:CDS:1 n=1 Tax=Diversispora eburnea TaxID=1213867 RepID=A0A9N9BTY0_9GLOM|nr:6536_t:CDS:2 [Diversispora eburnea]
MSTEQEAPNNLGHNVLSGLHKRLHSLDYTDEESTRSNNNNNNNSVEQQPQLTQQRDAGDVLGNRLYSVYKRFEGLFNIGSNAVMCRRCLHRTDKDPE